MRGKGKIHPTDDYVTEHVMLANRSDEVGKEATPTMEATTSNNTSLKVKAT